MKNIIKIIKLYLSAWLLRSVEAQFTLGDIYYLGTLVPKNYVTSAKWYRKAAEQGHRDSSFNLGCMYYYGQGVLPAYDEAVRWVRLSEKHRDSLAYETIERWAMIKKGE